MPDDPVPPPVMLSESEGIDLVREPERHTGSHERHPHPCQHAYMNLRGRSLGALTQSRRFGVLNHAQSAARGVLLVLDVPARWLMDICDTLIGSRGYVAIGTVFAAYFAVFGLIDAKSTQEETRASLERSLFVTLVSSENAASFVAAMKDFGSTQTMRVTEHPSWFRLWDWGRTYQPNKDPMGRWALWRLPLCNQDAKDCSLERDSRIDLRDANLIQADLSGADLLNANLTHADLSGAHLFNANLSRADLQDANLSRADLGDANLSRAGLEGANLSDAILIGADLRDAFLIGADLRFANLRGADLGAADLSGAGLNEADLSSADLSGAEHLTQDQLNQACGKPRGLPLGMTLDKPCLEHRAPLPQRPSAR